MRKKEKQSVRALKVVWLVTRLFFMLAAVVVGGYFLFRYEYLAQFAAVDNIVGMIPVALVLVAVGAFTALLWMKHQKRFIPVSATIAAFAVLAVALFPTALRGNWWLNGIASGEAEAKPDLTVYAPFTGEKTARLDEASTLKLTGDLPKLDGATALYPVYAAFAEAAYDASVYTPEKVVCTNTRYAYEAVIAGTTDIIFVAGASNEQMAAAEKAGVTLKFTPIGTEAFVFLTGKNNPVDSVTTQQLRNIYSGKTARWSTLGWKEGGDIIAFQRPEGSGSQTGLQRLIMPDLPIQSPQPLPDASLIGENSLLKQVSVEWKGVQPALGYSYRFYATAMYANPDSKLLKINGIAPSEENIQNGTYPFVSNFFAVTQGEPTGNTKLLIDWILSLQGQSLITQTGYTAL